ncbi:type VI secretion system tube protein Hcp [Dyadobacter sp. NIV53]|uniref:type VI secretion system tube protein Hcp n=1 Tax=Dyadobacter sp. NIV53 TaxID=2861765 RepID=UPI001C881337|nr:type VI secretion system tube protein Hcp [Dyadobacter sp. NIV53]
MKKISFLIVFGFSLFVTSSLSAQQLFLKAGTLTQQGSIYKGFENYVQISGVQYGVEALTSYKSTGAAVGKANFGEIVITKNVDILTNELLRSISKGTLYALMEIVSTKNTADGQKVSHKIELKNVYVTNVSNSAVEGCPDDCAGLEESVKFVYKSIRITTYSTNVKTGVLTANLNPFVFDVTTMSSTF